jgi:hypothetical protein
MRPIPVAVPGVELSRSRSESNSQTLLPLAFFGSFAAPPVVSVPCPPLGPSPSSPPSTTAPPKPAFGSTTVGPATALEVAACPTAVQVLESSLQGTSPTSCFSIPPSSDVLVPSDLTSIGRSPETPCKIQSRIACRPRSAAAAVAAAPASAPGSGNVDEWRSPWPIAPCAAAASNELGRPAQMRTSKGIRASGRTPPTGPVPSGIPSAVSGADALACTVLPSVSSRGPRSASAVPRGLQFRCPATSFEPICVRHPLRGMLGSPVTERRASLYPVLEEGRACQAPFSTRRAESGLHRGDVLDSQ